MGILFNRLPRKVFKPRGWSPIILLLILIGLAIWATQCRQDLFPLGGSAQNNIACSANGYQAVYYPSKNSLYQQIILENASGTESSLNKFINQYIKNGNQALADIRDLTCLDTLEVPYVAGAKVTDLTPLSALTNLKTLVLTNTDVDSIAELGQLQKLASLTLNLSRAVDLSPLVNLNKLKTFTVCGEWVNRSCTGATINIPFTPPATSTYPKAFADLATKRPDLTIRFGF